LTTSNANICTKAKEAFSSALAHCHVELATGKRKPEPDTTEGAREGGGKKLRTTESQGPALASEVSNSILPY